MTHIQTLPDNDLIKAFFLKVSLRIIFYRQVCQAHSTRWKNQQIEKSSSSDKQATQKFEKSGERKCEEMSEEAKFNKACHFKPESFLCYN